MSLTAIEKIKAIQDKAEQEIAELRREAASELARKISVAKEELRALEAEYEAVTGKPVRASTETPEDTGKRAKRLTKDEEKELSEKIKVALKGWKTGMKLKDIIKEMGIQGVEASENQIRKALKGAKGVTTTGERASTLYFAK